MSRIFHPIHQYQPQVERLRAASAAAGTPLTHSEALQLVASMQDQHSGGWDHLPQHPPKSLWARLVRARPDWCRHPVVNSDELLYDLKLDKAQLGVEKEYSSDHCAVPVWAEWSWLQRGLLLVGPDGKGATTFLEHFLSQQVARGGGMLVLDGSPNSYSPAMLERIATLCGRSDFEHVTPIEREEDFAHVVTSARKSMEVKGISYVNLALMLSRYTAKDQAQALVDLLLEMFPEVPPDPELRPRWPYFLVLPEGGWLLTEHWLPLLRYFRQRGILPVVRLHSLGDLDRCSAELTEALMNFGTQLYLEPSGDAARDAVVRELVPSGDYKKRGEVRNQLATLGLGAALYKWPEGPRYVRLCMLTKETREEWHQQHKS